MKFFKLPILALRIITVSLIIIVTIILTSRQFGVEKMVKKMFKSSFSATNRTVFLEIEKDYLLCRHIEITKTSYHSQKFLQEYLIAHPEYHVRATHQNCFEYYIRINQYCPSCQNNHFLGIKNTKVLVIRGTPSKPGPVLETTKIQMDELPKLELEDLKKGIPYKGEHEKLQLIEGLNSLSTN